MWAVLGFLLAAAIGLVTVLAAGLRASINDTVDKNFAGTERQPDTTLRKPIAAGAYTAMITLERTREVP